MNVPVWAAFAALVVAMLALDMFVLQRRAHEVPLREAGAWSGVGGDRAGVRLPLHRSSTFLAITLAAVWVKMLTADVYQVLTWAAPVFIAAVLAVVISIRSPHRTHLRSNPAGFQ